MYVRVSVCALCVHVVCVYACVCVMPIIKSAIHSCQHKRYLAAAFERIPPRSCACCCRGLGTLFKFFCFESEVVTV